MPPVRSGSTAGGRSSQDDGRSVISGHSGGTSTLVADSIAAASAKSATSQLRKFTAGVGRPGLAREAREAVRTVIGHANPQRKPPLSAPLDYEKFVTEHNIQLENDPQRELLLFPRDDVQETLIEPECATVVSTVPDGAEKNVNWLLTKEALDLYRSPHHTITFNYAKFAGDYNTLNEGSSSDMDVALSSLVFESDMALEEDRTAALSGFLMSGVVREGYLLVVKTDNKLLDNFKSEKRRYCVLRRLSDGSAAVDVLKSAGAPPTRPSVRVAAARLTSTKKGKTVLEFEPARDPGDESKEKSLCLAAEGECAMDELTDWLSDANRVIAMANKADSISVHSVDDTPADSCVGGGGEGTGSAGMAGRKTCADTSADTASIASEDSAGRGESVWRGRTSAARALQPPIVDRRNLFSVYYNLHPMSDARGEPSCVLGRRRSGGGARSSGPSSSLPLNTSQPLSRTASLAGHGKAAASADPVRDRFSPPQMVRFTVELTKLDLRLPVSATCMQQIEPFFASVFLFDAQSGRRISEEFQVDVNDGQLEGGGRGRGREGEMHGVSTALLTSTAANTMVCSVAAPHKELWVVCRVDRMLSGDTQGDLYMKSSGDAKATARLQKTIQLATPRLAGYTTRFAWAARPVFHDARSGELSPTPSPARPEQLQLYRCADGSRLTEADLQKMLHEYAKIEKAGKLAIPNASVTVRVDIGSRVNELPFRVSPSLLPLRPRRSPSDSPVPPAFELQSFGDVVGEPHSALVNLLYVYPLALKYDSQKVFGKARNISVTVRLVRGGGDAAEKAIVCRLSPGGPLVSSASCAIQHHQQNPAFGDEVKVCLPLSLTRHDHLLFSFAHVAVAAHGSVKSPEGCAETPVGYAWLPLLGKKERLAMECDEQEFSLPVAADLPHQYWRARPMGLGKGEEGPEIRWVEQRPLFRVRLRIVSSAFTTEPRLHDFFQACQRLESKRIIGDAAELTGTALSEARSCSPIAGSSAGVGGVDEATERQLREASESLLEVPVSSLIPFLPLVLQRLLSLLPAAPTETLAIGVITALVSICDRVSAAGRKSLLRQFIRLHFSDGAGAASGGGGVEGAVWAAIAKYLPVLLRSASSSLDELSCVYRQMWFILDAASKSLAQTTVRQQLYKTSRSSRFPAEQVEAAGQMIDALVTQIVARHRELPEEARAANTATVLFIRCCISFMDRGAVLRWVHSAVQRMDEHESRALRELKADLLQLLSQHEHWLSLSLPVLVDSRHKIHRVAAATSQDAGTTASSSAPGLLQRFFNQMFNTPALAETTDTDRYALCGDEWWLSGSYAQRHFPTGLIIQELVACMREPREYRRRPIALLRNLLAKHSNDRRYADLNMQRRIAMLYAPLLRFALDHIDDIEQAVASAAAHTPVATTAPATEDAARPSSKWRSLDRRLAEAPPSPSIGTTIREPSHHIRPPAPPPPLPSTPARADATAPLIAPLTEKLDMEEVQDILAAVLYVVHRLPKKVLGVLWKGVGQPPPAPLTPGSDPAEVRGVQWLRLLEIALEVFRYRGRQHAKQRTGHTIRGTLRSLHLVPPSSSRLPSTQLNHSAGQEGGDENSGSGGGEEPPPFGVLQLVNMSQETALIVLDAAQTVAQHIAAQESCTGTLRPHSSRHGGVAAHTVSSAVFARLLSLHLSLLEEHWPEAVRLHAIAALALFSNLFRSRLLEWGSMDQLALFVERVLLQMSSRLTSVQTAAAALLQLLLRHGYETASQHLAGQALVLSVQRGDEQQKRHPTVAERLGRSGAQTGVALARLLGRADPAWSPLRFERGLCHLEQLVATDRKATSFDRAVQELIGQLRGVMTATSSLVDAANDPIRLADLHIQLADSYRGSAALRSAWWDGLAMAHARHGWHAEAAVCHAHSVAICAKELAGRGELKEPEWSVLDWVSREVAEQEAVSVPNTEAVEPAGYTLENLASRVEAAAASLTLAERFEAVGPLYRLLIPALERQGNHQSLISVYAELQQTSSRAAEVKTSGKRHLGAYFRIRLTGPQWFGPEHGTEWVIREPGLTSLAECSLRLRDYYRQLLGHERVRVEPEPEDESSISLDPSYAYVRITHLEPMPGGTTLEDDELTGGEERERRSLATHTGLRRFVFESVVCEGVRPRGVQPPITQQALRRTQIKVRGSFPSCRRRLRVESRRDRVLTPLQLAINKLTLKAVQLRSILDAAAGGGQLDVKGLQLLLQGAVMPTVNAGPLAYAEAFTQKDQVERYGEEGTKKLAAAFRELVCSCEAGLAANEAAVGADQATYHQVLAASLQAMRERLHTYFGVEMREDREMSVPEPPRTSIHILDSIGGINA